MISLAVCNTMWLDLSKEEHMLQKFRVIKSIDSEGRKVITYIKNSAGKDGKSQTKAGKNDDKNFPQAVEMVVKLP